MGLHVAVDGGIDIGVRSRMNEERKVWVEISRMFQSKSLGMNEKKGNEGLVPLHFMELRHGIWE